MVELIRGFHCFLAVAFRNALIIVGIREIPDLSVVENTDCFTRHVLESSMEAKSLKSVSDMILETR